MNPITRRASVAGLLGVTAAAAIPRGLRAGAAPAVLPGSDIPPGIGKGFRHIGFSDQGRLRRKQSRSRRHLM